MTLVDKQHRFAVLISRLILELDGMGYVVAWGEAWRSPETCKLYAQPGGVVGITNSLHPLRLAGDLVLRRNGELLVKTEDYKEAGEIWKAYSGPDFTCVWGGEFGDGNHFSILHQGRK